MILGRRVKTGLTAIHLKPVCARARTPLLRPWTRAHDGGNYYKKVMADRCNITTIKRICLLSTKKRKILNHDLKKGRSNAAI